jgi:hypothetical protein
MHRKEDCGLRLALGKKHKTLFKEIAIVKNKRAMYMAQMVDHLPSKPETLSSNSHTTKKRKEKLC